MLVLIFAFETVDIDHLIQSLKTLEVIFTRKPKLLVPKVLVVQPISAAQFE